MEACNKVYVVNVKFLEDEKTFENWYQQMPAERRQKIDAMKPLNSKCLSLGASLLLMHAFKEQGIVGPVILLGENGKPYFEGEDGAFFNLSHSGEMAACAFSDADVGIDIEKNKDFNESLVNYVFDDREIRYVREHTHNKEEEDIFFTRLWTVKESLMKYTGKGLSMDPKKIYIDLGNGYKAYYEGEELNVSFTCYEINGCQITVCSEYEEFSEQVEVCEF